MVVDVGEDAVEDGPEVRRHGGGVPLEPHVHLFDRVLKASLREREGQHLAVCHLLARH